MRTLSFWSGIVCALLCGLVDPVWGYLAVFALSLVQLSLLGASGGSVFLLIHYATLLTYFSIAPAMQLAEEVSFWDAGLMSAASHTQALALLLLYMAGVEAAQLGVRAGAPMGVRPNGQLGAQPGADLSAHRLAGAAHPLLLLGCALAAFAVLLLRPDLNFVARGVVGDEEGVPFDLIFLSTLPKLLVLMCFVALAIHAVRRRTLWSWCAAALALALAAIAANPVNTARQVLLVGLLPLLVHLLGRSRRRLLAGVIFGAVAGLGPVLNLFSRGAMWGEGLTTFPFSPDFDAMFVVAGILERAPIPDLGWGRYLLSAFSFFLPRDLKMFPDFDPLGWSLVMLAAYVPFMRGPILGWGPFAASGLIAALIAGALSSRGRRPAVRAVRVVRPVPRDLPSA
jgi:hypothetical protein